MTDAHLDGSKLPALLEAAIPFVRYIGLTFIDAAPGRGVARLDAHQEISNYLGSIHAGATFTAAEAASGAAVAGLIEPILLECAPVTRDATIAYRRPANGTLVATATVAGDAVGLYQQIVGDGRADLTVDVDVHDADDTLVAQAEIIWHVRRRTDRSGDT